MNTRIDEFPARVKAAVDAIYERTLTACPTPMNGWNSLERRIGCIMSDRGILKNLGVKTKPAWHWNSELAPTDTLYLSLLDELRAKTSEKNSAYQAKAKEGKKAKEDVAPATAEAVMVTGKVKPVDGMTLRRATLRDYSAQELWNELKRRGIQIGPDCRPFIKIELD